MAPRFFIELLQPESHDEFQTFHQTIIQALHDQSERFDDPFSDAKYRSWIGLSYPIYGQLELYERAEYAQDPHYRLHYAIKHPGKFLGNVVHCISSEPWRLEALISTTLPRSLSDDSCSVSEILSVPDDCEEVINKRDRRPERRSEKNKTKPSNRTFNIGSQKFSHNPSPLTEPVPRICNFSTSGKRKPLHICSRSSERRIDGWYSMYGLSRGGSTVPLVPVQNTLFLGLLSQDR
ncbi:type I-F CRISPR-associated endoribonuclease Cas6/Csy4 [Endozoicomonas lisbonensis]|uniref:CRISPR-associated endoribonuclease Cas6/Csy4 subtype I-F n=1 Tax=Endozoicomonas lisbonensis TaxID=3120522 RepID=A0ABV2SF32_9GAMM